MATQAFSVEGSFLAEYLQEGRLPALESLGFGDLKLNSGLRIPVTRAVGRFQGTSVADRSEV